MKEKFYHFRGISKKYSYYTNGYDATRYEEMFRKEFSKTRVLFQKRFQPIVEELAKMVQKVQPVQEFPTE